jgi:hypothetical protein
MHPGTLVAARSAIVDLLQKDFLSHEPFFSLTWLLLGRALGTPRIATGTLSNLPQVEDEKTPAEC